ncbi:MAG: histidine phosphatase family protein [Candidatus Zixiibacteriota bacterium]
MSSQGLLLFLIRHAESEANASRTFAARVIDPPLSPKGVTDAERIAARLAPGGIRKIYASPLHRSLQTAQTLASKCQLEVNLLPDLREVDVGVLDGKSSKSKENWEIYELVLERWSVGDMEAAFEGGESLGEVCERAQRVLEILCSGSDSGRIAVVTHAVFLMIFLPLLLNDSLTDLKRYSLPRGSITTLTIRSGEAQLLDLGSIEHLQR